MVKLPAGRTTISGQFGQSRNTAPGFGAVESVAFTSRIRRMVTPKMNDANSKEIRRLFISTDFLKVTSDDAPVLHDESNALELSDVGDRVSGNCDEISKLPRFNRANAVLPPEHFSRINRDGANRV